MLNDDLKTLQNSHQIPAAPIPLQVEVKNSNDDTFDFNIRELADPYLKHWLHILGSMLICGVAGFGIASLLKPVYTASAGGIITAPQDNDISAATSADVLAKSRAKTYVTVATSEPVAQNVIKLLNLQNTTPQSLISRISVANTTDTPVISIQAKGSTPQEAKDLADGWVKSLAIEIDSIESTQKTTTDNTQTQKPATNGVIRLVPNVEASLPTAPSSPNKLLFTLVSLMLGAGLGGTYAWYQGKLDTRIRSRAALEDNFATPILGLIPQSADAEELIDLENSANGKKDNYHSVEAYRKLRTNLRFANVDKKMRSLVITSPEPSDGKSTIAANLAIALAASNQKVVIIDADLRRPTVTKKFDINTDGIGLAEVLTEQVTLEETLKPLPENQKIFILPAGTIPPNPSELLQSQAMENLINTLQQEDCTIIIDTPPILAVSDAASVAHFTDGTLLVVSANKSKIEDIKESFDVLKKTNANPIGLILNNIPASGTTSKYYGYSANNQYYYEEKKEK